MYRWYAIKGKGNELAGQVHQLKLVDKQTYKKVNLQNSIIEVDHDKKHFRDKIPFPLTILMVRVTSN